MTEMTRFIVWFDMELNQGTPDWHLPLEHEAPYWKQFLKGGRTFIDVGAHVGTWTLHLAPHFERVIAFEPDPRGWQVLSRNLKLNGIDNVEIVPKAVSNTTGSTRLNLFHNPCSNTVMDPGVMERTDSPIGQHEVETVSIDQFVESRGINDVDFVKIDAEGAELLIVEGAVRTLQRHLPDLFIEMHGLFYDRLRKLLPFLACDVLDGGRAGLSLVKHRDHWPDFANDDFRVYPPGVSPTIEDMRSLRLKHGIDWQPPRGFLAATQENQ
jgi:FkbM family methyltransferase